MKPKFSVADNSVGRLTSSNAPAYGLNPWVETSSKSYLPNSVVYPAKSSAGHRYLIRMARDATTPLSGSRYKVDASPGYAFLQYRSTVSPFNRYFEWGISGIFSTIRTPSPSPLGPTNADNQAKMKFLSAARAAQSSLQGGVVLGELRETLHQIRHPAQSLRNALGAYLSTLRKGRNVSKNRKVKFLSDSWLEFHFGIKPLLSDINGACEALAKFNSGVPHRVPVRAFYRDVGNFSQLQASENHGDISWTRIDCEQAEVIVIYRGAVTLANSGSVDSFQQLFGLSIGDFIPTIWEVIPWSFFIDYFTNIGSILSAWSYPSSNFSWKNKTTIIRAVNRTTYIHRPYKNSNVIVDQDTFQPPVVTVVKDSFNRESITGDLIPTLSFQVPGMSSLRWVNIAALLDQKKSLTPF